MEYEMLFMDWTDGKWVVKFPSNLDTNMSVNLEKELEEKLENKEGPIVFDMKGVGFVSSMFLRICLKMYHQATGTNFEIINASSNVIKAFKLGGFDKFIKIVEA